MARMPYPTMTTQDPFQPPADQPAEPFESTPTEPIPGGCSRAGVIGCGVVILLLGIASVIFLLKAGDLFAWAMSRFEIEITRALPEDFSDADRQRLERAFAGASESVRTGEFDPLALQRLQSKLRQSLLDEDQKLTREEALELIEILEEVAGAQPDDGPAEEEASGEASSIAA